MGREGFGLVQEPLLSGFCEARCLAVVKPVVEARDRPPLEQGGPVCPSRFAPW